MTRAWLALALLLVTASAFASDAIRKSVAASTETGTLDGAAYRIDIPDRWNRGLVVFYHGYSTTPVTFEKDERISPMFDGMLARGFAVIQSAYSASGWAVEEGAADTERLRKHFVEKHGKPRETIVAGMSMGGTLTVMAIEAQPSIYEGALSLCGAIEPSDRLMQRDFALRAAFDYYFPGLLGTLVPVPADFALDDATTERVAAALKSNPKAERALLSFYGVADAKTLPDIIAFNTFEIREMQQRTHGNPFGNADLVYTGSGDDAALNDGVKRYRADTAAVQRMARFYTPTGKLEKPLLALHDTGDPLVPAGTAFEYAIAAQRVGRGDNFVQQYVNRKGHCVFTPAEINRAFGELLDWIRDGKRPHSGRLD
jgi:pimeloyl-ACP methyl ester carboxylesterase